jgi:putative DNA primase/helicase
MNAANLEVLSVRPENLPEEMKVRPQWVNWRREKRGGDLTKVPYTPGTERRASSTDLMTWGTFEEALASLDRFDGIGFMFCSGDSYTAVDLDKCVDPETGEIEAWAAEIVEALDFLHRTIPERYGATHRR